MARRAGLTITWMLLGLVAHAAAQDAKPAASPPVPPPIVKVTVPTYRPKVSGPRHVLAVNKPLELKGGRTITWAGTGHKIADRGPARPAIHEVTISNGKDEDSIRIGSEDGEAEADVFGLAVVFTGTWKSLAVTVVGPTPKALDDDKRSALIEQRAAKAKLPPAAGGMSMNESEGFVHYTAFDDQRRALWRARLGLYTRRVWFEPPRHDRECEDNPLAKGCP